MAYLKWKLLIEIPCKDATTKENDNHDDVIKWKHFRVTGPLCGNSPVPVNSPTKASDAELWCFIWSASELTVE